jgi:GT2 family glycosyltransferase
MDTFLHDLYANMPDVSGKIWLLRRGKNDGMAAAVNDGLGFSRAEYVFITNNDVEFTPNFHKKMFDTFSHQPNIGILGVWRHAWHGFVKGGIMNEWFREMDDVPSVGWMLPKTAMERVGFLDERGACFVPHGNGEDTNYVQRMKAEGYLVGVTSEDIGTHLTGYDG